jgi:hypothetical protein
MESTHQEPTVEQLNSWFEVLHRLAVLQHKDPRAAASSPAPLRQDVADCVERSWVRAWRFDESKSNEMQLLITPEGRVIYDQMCRELAIQGRPVLGWTPHDPL